MFEFCSVYPFYLHKLIDRKDVCIRDELLGYFSLIVFDTPYNLRIYIGFNNSSRGKFWNRYMKHFSKTSREVLNPEDNGNIFCSAINFPP